MSIFKYCIVVLATVSCMVATAQDGIVERECWLDNNFAARQAIAASPATVDISALPAGLHWLTMRVQDGMGVWSPALTQAFIIPHEVESSSYTTIQRREIWLDNNFAARQTIAASPTSVDISSLPAGLHWFTMRVQDDLGLWSPALTQAFIIPHEIDASSASVIQRREVWFDNNYAARQEIGNSPVSLDISSLSAGLHTLTIRAQDDLGRWSSTVTEFFIKPHAVVEEDVELVNYCYWVDDDVEHAVAGTLPVSGKTVAGVIYIDMSTLPSGRHTISYMVGDSKGAWSNHLGVVATMEFFNGRGDVNGDGEVNIADVTAIIDYLLTGEESGIDMEATNCDLEGGVDIGDVTALIDYLMTGQWP